MKHTNLWNEVYKGKRPKKMKWTAIFVGLLTLIATWLIFNVVTLVEVANAQEVSASVPCNEVNRLYSSSCMDWDEQGNSSGEIMGTPFYTFWITPERMLFWTPDAYWYVTVNGIE